VRLAFRVLPRFEEGDSLPLEGFDGSRIASTRVRVPHGRYVLGAGALLVRSAVDGAPRWWRRETGAKHWVRCGDPAIRLPLIELLPRDALWGPFPRLTTLKRLSLRWERVVGGRGTGPGQFRMPWDIAVNSAGDVIVADADNNRLQVLDRDRLEPKLLRKCGAFVRGVAVDAKDCVFATFSAREDVGVYVFDSQWKHIGIFGDRGNSPGEFGVPSGVCARRDGTVAVADFERHVVNVYTSRGVFLFAFGGKGAEDGHFARAWRVQETPSGTLVVSEDGGGRLQEFDHLGRFLRCLSRGGIAPGQFRSPGGFSCSADGAFVVADSQNHRVQVLDPNGAPLCALGTQGAGDGQFDQPRCARLLTGGRVLVTDSLNDRVVLLMLETEFAI
jgi:DNA-binding beta-propeller fold protein YncE